MWKMTLDSRRRLLVAALFAALLSWPAGCDSGSGTPVVGGDVVTGSGDVSDAGPSGDAAGAGDVGTGGDDTFDQDSGPQRPAVCDEVPVLPLGFERIRGPLATEDFAFDADGHVVGADEEGNLFRSTKDGDTSLFVPNAGGAIAGLRFLPGGDLVYASVDDGTLYRVAPNGVKWPLLSGFSYPNGIEVDLEGFVYVAEQDAGRVRRVDAETGAFTIVADGLYNPNGLTFDPSYRTLYIGSFGAGTVWSVAIAEDGTAGALEVFARTPNAPDPDTLPPPLPPPNPAACEGKDAGAACTFEHGGRSHSGECKTFGGVLVCDPVPDMVQGDDPCVELSEGDDCELDWGEGPMAGTCVSWSGELFCDVGGGVEDPCTSLSEGAQCRVDWGAGLELGRCVAEGGDLFCLPDSGGPDVVTPCDGKGAGDACAVDFGGEPVDGTCLADGYGLWCSPDEWPGEDGAARACDDKAEGDPCEYDEWGTLLQGLCVDDGSGLWCASDGPAGDADACVGKSDGDRCEYPAPEGATPGTCFDDGAGALLCYPDGGMGGAGGLDGMAVDACGYVYVSEFTVGTVWRISPDGQTIERLFHPRSEWVPNMQWGTGRGGWDATTLYVIDREPDLLYAIALGVPGKPRPYPQVSVDGGE